MAGGVCYSSAAVLTVALLMLVSVSSFGFSPHPNVRLRRNGHDRYTSTTSITTTSSSRRCSSSRQQRRDITCGLQVVVRIRGKKSREEDYTNQVRALLKSFLACKPRLHALHVRTPSSLLLLFVIYADLMMPVTVVLHGRSRVAFLGDILATANYYYCCLLTRTQSSLFGRHEHVSISLIYSGRFGRTDIYVVASSVATVNHGY